MENQINENLQQNTPASERVEVVIPERKSRPLFDIGKGDTIFAVGAVVASIFTSIFGIFGGFALGYLLSAAFLIVLFSVYFMKDNKASLSTMVYGLLAIANSAVFICTTNVSVRFFGVIVSFVLSLVFYNSVAIKSACGNRETLGIFYGAMSSMGNVGVSLKSLFSGSDGSKKSIGKVMLGLLCAVPVLVIVLPLLISSDDAFRGMMNNIFSNTFATVMKTIFGVAVSIFVISYGFSLKYKCVSKTKESKFSGIDNIYIISFLSAFAVCYLLYLFSQLAYFFSAFKGFLPDGDITYAQYARKGFFEMCVIAVINLALILLSLLLVKKPNGKVGAGVRVVTTFISVFTLIIIATAISKMLLYINEYGMTVLRLTTSSFMIFLSVVFISVILRIYIKRINIVKTALIAAGIVVLLLGTINVNAVCARYNYESYNTGKLKSIDIEAMYNLGDEGIPYIVKLAESEDDDISYEAYKYLYQAYIYDYFDYIGGMKTFTVEDLKHNQEQPSFSYFSIPKSQAYNALYEYIEKNPDFCNWCHVHGKAEEYNW